MKLDANYIIYLVVYTFYGVSTIRARQQYVTRTVVTCDMSYVMSLLNATIKPTSPYESRHQITPCLPGVSIIYLIVYTFYFVYAAHDRDRYVTPKVVT